MDKFTPDAAAVRTAAQSQRIGILEAKALLRRESMLRALDSAASVYDLKDILRALIEDGR